jgi:hypothetical protein
MSSKKKEKKYSSPRMDERMAIAASRKGARSSASKWIDVPSLLTVAAYFIIFFLFFFFLFVFPSLLQDWIEIAEALKQERLSPTTSRKKTTSWL